MFVDVGGSVVVLIVRNKKYENKLIEAAESPFKTVVFVIGYDSVDRVVVSGIWGLQFKSSERQKYIMNIFTVNSWKGENKEKEAVNGPQSKEMSMLHP